MMRRKRKEAPIIPLPVRENTTTPVPLKGVRLPPFSADNTACSKCGHRQAKTLYFAAGRTCIHLGSGFRVVWGVERLHRVCLQCQFSWDEACVPAIPQEVKQTMLLPVVK